MLGSTDLRRLSGAALIRVRDLSARDEGMLPVTTTVLSPLPLHITVPVGDTPHVNPCDQRCSHPVNRLPGSEAARRQLLLHCGPLPLGGPGGVVDVESPPQIVLSLLPARRQSRQLMVLSGTRHVLVQERPIRLQNRKTSRGGL